MARLWGWASVMKHGALIWQSFFFFDGLMDMCIYESNHIMLMGRFVNIYIYVL